MDEHNTVGGSGYNNTVGEMNEHNTVGTCSLCGGRVSVPRRWAGVTPPIPTCESCGATPRHPHGPVIEMRWPRETRTNNGVDDPRPITNGVDG